jgi:glycopeptide antibiotics resistance protein
MDKLLTIFSLTLCLLVWFCIVLFLRLRKRKSHTYILLFSIFYIYIIKVLDYTLFQFQILIVLKHFMPNLMLRGHEAGETLNLIPLITLGSGDIKTSLLNILLMAPFGFGLPFITNFKFKNVFIAGMLFSVFIELMQLLTGLIANVTFRVTDINDVIFNTLGVVIGYVLFVATKNTYSTHD